MYPGSRNVKDNLADKNLFKPFRVNVEVWLEEEEYSFCKEIILENIVNLILSE